MQQTQTKGEIKSSLHRLVQSQKQHENNPLLISHCTNENKQYFFSFVEFVIWQKNADFKIINRLIFSSLTL